MMTHGKGVILFGMGAKLINGVHDQAFLFHHAMIHETSNFTNPPPQPLLRPISFLVHAFLFCLDQFDYFPCLIFCELGQVLSTTDCIVPLSFLHWHQRILSMTEAKHSKASEHNRLNCDSVL
jgi:hypothetical protein